MRRGVSLRDELRVGGVRRPRLTLLLPGLKSWPTWKSAFPWPGCILPPSPCPLLPEGLDPGLEFGVGAEEPGFQVFVKGAVVGLEKTGAVEEYGGVLARGAYHAADGLADAGKGGLAADLVVGGFLVLGLEAVHSGALDVVGGRERRADDDGAVDLATELIYAFGEAAAEQEEEDFMGLEGVGEELVLLLEGEALGLKDSWERGIDGLEEWEDGLGVLVGGEVGDDGLWGIGSELVDGAGGGVVVGGTGFEAGVDASIDGELVGVLPPRGFGLDKGWRGFGGKSDVFGEVFYGGEGGGKEEAGAKLAEGIGNFVGGVEAVEAVLAGLGGKVEVGCVGGGEEFFKVE